METVTVKNRKAIDSIITNAPEETINFGRRFSKNLKPGTVVALYGDLGSGKTTFVKGVCEGLNIEDTASSPTFTLINEYYGELPVYHFDFYRIANSDEASETGCEDYFSGDGICLIEWPENVAAILPKNRIEIHFKNCFDRGFDTRREIRITEK